LERLLVLEIGSRWFEADIINGLSMSRLYEVPTITAHRGGNQSTLRLLSVHPSPKDTKLGPKYQLKKLQKANISVKLLIENVMKTNVYISKSFLIKNLLCPMTNFG
jgi:hypothetical protein